MRWFVLAMLLVSAVVASDVAAQNRSNSRNPAEHDKCTAARGMRDRAKRATAMEVFAAWYPDNVLKG